MSTPPPVVPPRNPVRVLLIGCLVVFGLVAMAAIMLVTLGVIAAKREQDAMTPAQRAAEREATNKRLDAEEAERLAPTLNEGKAAQARLAHAAESLPALADLKPLPCPHKPGQSLDYLPVDAELFRSLRDGVPGKPTGTPWFRHRVFADVAEVPLSDYPSAENQALALIRADKESADAGHIAVIETEQLVEPKPHDDDSFDTGLFKGWIELVAYPAGNVVCTVPFSALSSEKIGGGIGIGLRIRGISIPITGALPKPTVQQQIDDDFQSNFWAAAEAAIGR